MKSPHMCPYPLRTKHCIAEINTLKENALKKYLTPRSCLLSASQRVLGDLQIPILMKGLHCDGLAESGILNIPITLQGVR